MANASNIEKARRDIAYTTDGPVTGFVLIMRALRAVKAGGDPEAYGNALAELLADSNDEIAL